MNISDYIGIPWVRGGRDKSGADCLGLAIMVRKAAGKEAPDYQYAEPSETEVACMIEEALPLYKRLERPEPWCYVTFRDLPPLTTHVGVVLPDCQSFIHTRSVGPKRSVIERLSSPTWGRRITGYFDYES